MPTFLNKSNRTQAAVTLVASLTMAAGLLTLIRPIAERMPDRLTDLLQPIDTSGTRSYLLTGFGLVLVYISLELYRRKLAGWWAAVGLVSINLALHLFIETSWPAVIFSAVILAVLVYSRRWFRARVHPDNVRQGLSLLSLSVLFSLVYGTVGFWLLDKHDFGIEFSVGQSFVRTLRAYLLIGNNDITPHTAYGRWFLHSLAIVGSLSLVYGLYGFFRPLRARYLTQPGERERAKALLERYGGETDDFFKLWPTDKSYFFSSDGRAFVAYGVANGTALCFAGPVGEAGSIARLLKEFIDFCESNGWNPCFAQTSDRFDKQLTSAGFDSLVIGADAVVDLEKFVNQTARNKKFRNIYNRFLKQGYRTEYYQPPHSKALLFELKAVSRSWLSRAGRKEWRFFTGYYNREYLQQTPLFVARDSSGRALAFVNQLPDYKHGEATIDLMRHRHDIPTNLMDWLFIEFMTKLHQDGFKTFNLGLSPMAAKPFADSPADKFLAFVFSSNQKIISFKGLHQYKSKFEPDWQPRYLYYYGGLGRLPQIGLAVVKLIKF